MPQSQAASGVSLLHVLQVAILDSNEQRFLEASMAFARGTPIVSDAEYDKLKVDLKTKSSVVTAEGPRCSLRSKKMYADADPDYIKVGMRLHCAWRRAI